MTLIEDARRGDAVIDQQLRDADWERVDDLARRGIIDCEWPREGETVEAFMRRKLAEDGREVPE